MSEPRSTPVVVFIGVLVLGGLAAALLPRLFGVTAAPETELIAQLKQTEADGLVVDLGQAGKLESSRHQFARISINVAPDGRSAVVTATLDFDGHLGATKISSVGAERISFVRREGHWVAPDGFAPRLRGIVLALEGRRRAIEAGTPGDVASLLARPEDAAAQLEALRPVLGLTDRRYEARAWYIRSERDEVLATEDYRLRGTTPHQPIDELGSKRLSLLRRGQEFLFASGLM